VGLSSAYFALTHTSVRSVRVLDVKKSVAALGGASMASAGLLHSFSRKGKKIWLGDEGFAATMRLVEAAEERTGTAIRQPGVGIVRISDDGTEDIVNGGCVLDPAAYLRGLWSLIQGVGADLDKDVKWVSVGAKEQLQSITRSVGAEQERVVRICALGAGVLDADIWPDAKVLGKLSAERGRNIILDNKSGLSDARIRGEYVVPNFGGNKVILGATHEREWDKSLFGPEGQATATVDEEPHLEALVGKIVNKGLLGMATVKDGACGSVRVSDGVRVQAQRTHLGRLPLVSRHPKNADTWLVTGFGSRGLIHSALVAKAVVSAAIKDDVSLIPSPIFVPPSS